MFKKSQNLKDLTVNPVQGLFKQCSHVQIFLQNKTLWIALKLQLHGAIYRLRFCSNSLIHILSLSNSHNNVASIKKNRGDKSHRVIVALHIMEEISRYQLRFILTNYFLVAA